MKASKLTPFHWLAIVLFAQFLATGYCIHRVEHATKTAAKEILDSMRLDSSIQRVLDDTLQILKKNTDTFSSRIGEEIFLTNRPIKAIVGRDTVEAYFNGKMWRIDNPPPRRAIFKKIAHEIPPEDASSRLDTLIPRICIYDSGRKVAQFKDHIWTITDTAATLRALLKWSEDESRRQNERFEREKRRDSL